MRAVDEQGVGQGLTGRYWNERSPFYASTAGEANIRTPLAVIELIITSPLAIRA